MYAKGVFFIDDRVRVTIGDQTEPERSVRRLHKLRNTWDEETADWDTPLNFSSNDYATANNYLPEVWEEWDVTSYIRDFVNEPSTNHGFIIQIRYDDYGVWYPSSESPEVALRPKLYINYGPVDIVKPKSKINKNGVTINKIGKYIKITAPLSQYNTQITNVRGQTVVTMKGGNGVVHIPENMLSKGIYFVTVFCNNRAISKKLVITE